MQKYSSLLILLIFFACSSSGDKDNLPKDVVSRVKMADIFTDMQIAEALVKATPHLGDTDTRSIIDYYGFILKKHGVSDTIFKVSYDYYMHHPILLDSVHSEVITRLSDMQSGLKAK